MDTKKLEQRLVEWGNREHPLSSPRDYYEVRENSLLPPPHHPGNLFPSLSPMLLEMYWVEKDQKFLPGGNILFDSWDDVEIFLNKNSST